MQREPWLKHHSHVVSERFAKDSCNRIRSIFLYFMHRRFVSVVVLVRIGDLVA